jgi:hypothetical protein
MKLFEIYSQMFYFTIDFYVVFAYLICKIILIL